jgi:hypothetical protein
MAREDHEHLIPHLALVTNHIIGVSELVLTHRREYFEFAGRYDFEEG